MIETLASGAERSGRQMRMSETVCLGLSRRRGSKGERRRETNLPEDYTSVYYHHDLFPPLDVPLARESESKALINTVIQHVERKMEKEKYVPSLEKCSALLMLVKPG